MTKLSGFFVENVSKNIYIYSFEVLFLTKKNKTSKQLLGKFLEPQPPHPHRLEIEYWRPVVVDVDVAHVPMQGIARRVHVQVSEWSNTTT